MSWKSSLIICSFLFAISSWSAELTTSKHNSEQKTQNNFALLLLSVSLGVGTNDYID